MLAAFLQNLADLPPPTDNLPQQMPNQMGASEAQGHVETGSLTSMFELNLTLIIFVFGLLAMTLLYFMIRHKNTTPFYMRIYVITILIFGSLLVVSSAYTTEQISPVIGFFGTIAGYILGRGDRPSDPAGPADDNDPDRSNAARRSKQSGQQGQADEAR